MITEEQALSIAEEECVRQGWIWYPHMMVLTKPKWDFWRVFTPGRGGGMAFHIDKETGAVRWVGRWQR